MLTSVEAFSSRNAHRCFCGPNVKPGRRAIPRSRLRVVTRAEESQTRTESESAQQSPSVRPSSNGAEGSEKKQGPRLSFAPNNRSGIGYTEDDSAGQTNIFAVEPRSYLAGSDRDVQVSPGANIAIVTAGSLAIAGIASGLIINFNNKEPRVAIEDEPGQYLTLSQYKDKFSSEAAPSTN